MFRLNKKKKYTLSDINLLINLFETTLKKEFFKVIFNDVLELNPELIDYLHQEKTTKFLVKYYRSILHQKSADEAIDLVFDKEIEDMPLYINHESKVIQITAKWRLMLGR